MATGLFSSRRRFKDRYDKRKEAGVCVRCGYKPPEEGSVSCAECNKKRNESAKKIKGGKKWKAYSIQNGQQKMEVPTLLISN